MNYRFIIPVLLVLVVGLCTVVPMRGNRGAGVLPYAWHAGQWYVLLGKEKRGWERGIGNQFLAWHSFGGTCDAGESDAEGASREFKEESWGVYDLPARDIEQCLSYTVKRPHFVFTNYCVEVQYMPVDEIKRLGLQLCMAGKVKDAHEKIDFVWVPLREFVALIEGATAKRVPHMPREYDAERCIIYNRLVYGLQKKYKTESGVQILQRAVQENKCGIVPSRTPLPRNKPICVRPS